MIDVLRFLNMKPGFETHCGRIYQGDDFLILFAWGRRSQFTAHFVKYLKNIKRFNLKLGSETE